MVAAKCIHYFTLIMDKRTPSLTHLLFLYAIVHCFSENLSKFISLILTECLRENIVYYHYEMHRGLSMVMYIFQFNLVNNLVFPFCLRGKKTGFMQRTVYKQTIKH